MYIVGVCTRDGFSDRDLNGKSWRDNIYGFFNYQISNYRELGKEASMFEPNTYSYPLVVIGQNSKVLYTNFGYYTEDDIRPEIRKALDGLGNLQQVKKADNVFMNSSKSVIDLSENFVTVNSDLISYDLLSVSDTTIVSVDLSNSQLTLTKGINTGITNVKVKAISSSETVIDSFDIMRYPTEANILNFEVGSLYEQWFHEGNADWYIEDQTILEGVNSARAGYIESPNLDSTYTHSIIRTTFKTTGSDTLNFAYKISSQYKSDGFKFVLDDEEMSLPKNRWSGEIDWSFAEYSVKAGKHTVEWDYFKYEYSFSGKDAAWIDIIKIPGAITSIEEIIVPSSTKLIGNYPNPFNGNTTITYQLSNIGNVKLAVYNIKGEFVQNLVNGVVNAGMHSATFNALNINSGVYFYKLEAGEVFQTGKMIYLK